MKICILNLFLSKQLTINECTLLDCKKYRDSYVLYIPTVHTFGSVNFTHTLLVQTHPNDVSAPWVLRVPYNHLI